MDVSSLYTYTWRVHIKCNINVYTHAIIPYTNKQWPTQSGAHKQTYNGNTSRHTRYVHAVIEYYWGSMTTFSYAACRKLGTRVHWQSVMDTMDPALIYTALVPVSAIRKLLPPPTLRPILSANSSKGGHRVRLLCIPVLFSVLHFYSTVWLFYRDTKSTSNVSLTIGRHNGREWRKLNRFLNALFFHAYYYSDENGSEKRRVMSSHFGEFECDLPASF